MRLTEAQAKAFGIVIQARVSAPTADAMNKTERRYAAHLEARRLNGEVWRWDFQPIKLRLADSTFYTPDFRVILCNGAEEMHEIKGFMRDDAAVKVKVAAEMHPYPFVVVRWVKGAWTFEWFEARKR